MHNIVESFASRAELLEAEIERLRAALHQIIGVDHHNHGPESMATKIAREALNQQSRESA